MKALKETTVSWPDVFNHTYLVNNEGYAIVRIMHGTNSMQTLTQPYKIELKGRSFEDVPINLFGDNYDSI